MGYNLDKLISSEKIIQRQTHTTPFYTLEGMKYRQEIKDTNGENNTLFAGAYLYDGLHEGAATSAIEVAKI
jgi:predicted NAD/FAD-binding protein